MYFRFRNKSCQNLKINLIIIFYMKYKNSTNHKINLFFLLKIYTTYKLLINSINFQKYNIIYKLRARIDRTLLLKIF